MRSQISLILMLGVLRIFCIATANAQPKPIPPETLQKAKEFFDKAESLYRVGDYEKAVDGYKEAYLLTKKPALLFNIAQCYRYLHRYEEALVTYQRFLVDEPKTAVRAEVEKNIKEMEVAIAEEKAKKAAASAPTVDPNPKSVPVYVEVPKEPEVKPASLPINETDTEPRATYKIFYGLSLGTGALSLAAGSLALVETGRSKKLQAQIEDPDDPRVGEVVSQFQTARSLGLASDALLVAAVVSGGVGLSLKLRSKKSEASVAVSPAGALTLQARF